MSEKAPVSRPPRSVTTTSQVKNPEKPSYSFPIAKGKASSDAPEDSAPNPSMGMSFAQDLSQIPIHAKSPLSTPAGWTHMLSQPGESEERQASARAANALRGGVAPLVQGVPRRTYMPHGTPTVITDQAGRGRPLPPAHAAYFASRFGMQFDHVRVHDDEGAAAVAEAADSKAFTIGSHMFFNRGEYQPGIGAGRSLLAHELAHVEQGHTGPARLWRQPKATVTMGQPTIIESDPQPEEEEKWTRAQVRATGMDVAAKKLAKVQLKFHDYPNFKKVFVGLHPEFIIVYDQNGNRLSGKIALKKKKGLVFNAGIYIASKESGMFYALETPDDLKNFRIASKPSYLAQATAKQKTVLAEEEKKAKAEGRQPRKMAISILPLITEPERFRSLVESPNSFAIWFVPSYIHGGRGKGRGGSKGIYSSPIEGRGDGQPANAPPWPVSAEGPKLVPSNSTPTFAAKVNWFANGNHTQAAQVISQVGESIHYKWELFDITRHAKKQLAKDPAATKDDPSAKPEKSLKERINDFKKSKAGTGTDVTGMGGANREFSREFENWWKDTKRASKGARNPDGDTVRERLSNAAANRLSLELAPVSLLTTAVGAVLRWMADLFAGPRQQQEIPLKTKGIFLVRVITTPAIREDPDGKPIIRPPSVAAKIVEVTSMKRAVRESLDEPAAQLAELQAQIDMAEKEGNMAKAEYLRSLQAEAKLRFEGSPLSLLIKTHDQKVKALDEFRNKYPTLSVYSREREIAILKDQIALFGRHQKQLDPSGGTLKRVNATLISEVTGVQYPLLISAGKMSMQDGRHRWLVSDVTNRDGDAFIGLGDTESAAFHSALIKFGKRAAYGRGLIGVRTAGLGLEKGARKEFRVDSAPADWALAQKRIDDLVMTLAALGLIVASAGTASAVIGAGVAAARLIQRWQAGKLYLDAQAVSDVLGVLGGLGAAGKLVEGLRIQKFDKVFAIVQEGRATPAQIARAAEALKKAQKLAKLSKVVEEANQILDYGGLMWGNISFLDEMLSISAQERSGAITHAEARRLRAGAISSAVQNNGFAIAGNVIKAKQQRKVAEKPARKSKEKQPAPDEKPSSEKIPPKEKVPTEGTEPKESAKKPVKKPDPDEKLPEEDVLPAEWNKPAQKPGEPVPLGERRATLEELQAALPSDLRPMLAINENFKGDDVRVLYRINQKTGLIDTILLRCGPDARPATVALHVATVRTMQKYQGFSGRVRQAVSWLGGLVGIETLDPKENPKSFEATQEINKLPNLIKRQMLRMKNMEPNARDMAEAELLNLENQLAKNLRILELGDVGSGKGFVAAKGLSKAKQKKYAELKAKLRTHDSGSEEHKQIRREMYELTGGDMPYAAWENIYNANQKRYTRSREIEEAELKKSGWGEPQLEVDVPGGGKRRLDIAEETQTTRRAVEVKAYESGRVYATSENLAQVEADRKLIRYRKWDIAWRFVDCEPSGPLLTALHKANITVEIRHGNGGLRKIPPPQK